MSALPGAAYDGGMDSLRLACLEGKQGGPPLLEAVGFRDLRDGQSTDGRPVTIMERLAAPDAGAEGQP